MSAKPACALYCRCGLRCVTERGIGMAGTLEYEQLNKNLEVVDGHAVKAPEDYQDPEQLYQALIARVRKYHPSADISMIEKAYNLGKEAHKDQVRKSGEPYIIHPLWVGIILADLEMDKETDRKSVV